VKCAARAPQDCYLQLHNYVSEETMSIQPIFSLETAAGLVIAHGAWPHPLPIFMHGN
jgi:hypothetical protein